MTVPPATLTLLPSLFHCPMSAGQPLEATRGSALLESMWLLASETPALALLALVSKTGGAHIPHKFTKTHGELVESMMLHLTAPGNLRNIVKTRPGTDKTHMGAVCACDNQSITRGYVCSTCLSINCTAQDGICAPCGARIRGEVKDEQYIVSQLFSKIFPNM